MYQEAAYASFAFSNDVFNHGSHYDICATIFILCLGWLVEADGDGDRAAPSHPGIPPPSCGASHDLDPGLIPKLSLTSW